MIRWSTRQGWFSIIFRLEQPCPFPIPKSCDVCGHPFPAGSEDDTICPDCLYGEVDDPDEPQEEDLVTDDHQRFFRFGMNDRRPVVQVPENEDWRIHIKAYMNRTMYWPNVWFISDHGNAHLLSLEEK